MATLTTNKQYSLYLSRWQKIRDCLDGEDRLKEVDLFQFGKNKNNSYLFDVRQSTNTYLRPINPGDDSDYNRELNSGYINGARYFEAPGRTLDGLMGMLFRNEPEFSDDMPESLLYLNDDVDGNGESLSQQSRKAAFDLSSVGRGGLLVEMPVASGEVTQADVNAGFRPKIHYYPADLIKDWNIGEYNGVKKLDLLVLIESYTEIDSDDPFGIRRVEKTRDKVYRLEEDGVKVYLVNDGDQSLGEPLSIRFSTGPADEIPFVFLGAKSNDPEVDKPPLEALVNVSLGDYQESANLCSTSFNLSAATPYIADDVYRNWANSPESEDEERMGDNTIKILGTGGRMDIVSPPSNPLAMEMREKYRNEMVELGAQIITEGGQAETAEAARIKHAADVSQLGLISLNLSSGYTKAVAYCGSFQGVEGGELTFNRDFFEIKLTPEQSRSIVETWQSGLISKNVAQRKLKTGGMIQEDVDLELMNGEIESEVPSDAGRFSDPQSNIA